MPSASSSAASVDPMKRFRFIKSTSQRTTQNSLSAQKKGCLCVFCGFCVDRRHLLFLDELLHTLAVVGFTGVDVALRIDRDAADAVKQAGIASAVAEAADLLER